MERLNDNTQVYHKLMGVLLCTRLETIIQEAFLSGCESVVIGTTVASTAHGERAELICNMVSNNPTIELGRDRS